MRGRTPKCPDTDISPKHGRTTRQDELPTVYITVSALITL